MEACRLPLLVDEADNSCECCARGEAEAGNSVEGMTGENVGLSMFDSNNGLGASGSGIYSGDSAGEVVGDSSGAVEGMTEITAGESATEGDAAGDEAEEIALASVSISTFIPWLQCPIVPQMKYLFPGDVRGMVVAPSL